MGLTGLGRVVHGVYQQVCIHISLLTGQVNSSDDQYLYTHLFIYINTHKNTRIFSLWRTNRKITSQFDIFYQNQDIYPTCGLKFFQRFNIFLRKNKVHYRNNCKTGQKKQQKTPTKNHKKQQQQNKQQQHQPYIYL